MSPASRALRVCRAAQAALDERRDEGAAIGGAGMNILRRVDRSCRGGRRLTDQIFVDRLTVQHGLHLEQALRPVARADDADMRVAHSGEIVLVIKEGDPRECEIALALREFPE